MAVHARVRVRLNNYGKISMQTNHTSGVGGEN